MNTKLTVCWLAAWVLAVPACTSTPTPAAASSAGGNADAHSSCPGGQGAWALSTCLTPKQNPAYYVDQAHKYFDALDRSAPAASVPLYAELVARWEWPPWLKLTGYTREQMVVTDKLVKMQAPAVVSHRDCRAFAVQPFSRCRISFDYDNEGGGKPCPIYEEFTFNDQGEITFIEAWSDAAGYLPTTNNADAWAEGSGVNRLSTRVPGLGNPTGKIDLDSDAMQQAASLDPDIADFVKRGKDFWTMFAEESSKAGDYFKVGCGW